MARLLHIVAPCSASWDAMAGTEAHRHCESCEKQVHNLSTMTADEADRLLSAHPRGTLCVRVDHDEHGVIAVRPGGRPPRRGLQLVVGASLIASACQASVPPHQRSVDQPSERAEHRDDVESVAPADSAAVRVEPDPTDWLDDPTATPLSTATAAGGNQGKSPAQQSGSPRAQQQNRASPSQRFKTIGCVCDAGDPLCGCL